MDAALQARWNLSVLRMARAMTFTNRLGLLKYLYNLGKEYADLFKGTLTPTLIAGYMANQAGHTATASAGTALLVPLATLVIAIVAGYVTWRWRIVHATIGHEWDANPYMRAQIDLLREIRDAVKGPQPMEAWPPGALSANNTLGSWTMVHGRPHDAKMAADHD